MKVLIVAVVATAFIIIFGNKFLEESRMESEVIGAEYRQIQYDEFEANEEWLSQEFLRIDQQYNDEPKAKEEWLAKEFLRIDREYGNISHPVNSEIRNAIIGDVKTELLRQVNEHSESVHGKSLNNNQKRIIRGEINELLKYVDVSSMIEVQRQGKLVSGLLIDYVDNVFN